MRADEDLHPPAYQLETSSSIRTGYTKNPSDKQFKFDDLSSMKHRKVRSGWLLLDVQQYTTYSNAIPFLAIRACEQRF